MRNYPGIKQDGARFITHAKLPGKLQYLGTFSNLEMAVEIRNKYITDIYGDSAILYPLPPPEEERYEPKSGAD